MWVEDGNCPNYFISDNNMLEGKMTRVQKRKLLEIIDEILNKEWPCVISYITVGYKQLFDCIYSLSESRPLPMCKDFISNILEPECRSKVTRHRVISYAATITALHKNTQYTIHNYPGIRDTFVSFLQLDPRDSEYKYVNGILDITLGSRLLSLHF